MFTSSLGTICSILELLRGLIAFRQALWPFEPSYMDQSASHQWSIFIEGHVDYLDSSWKANRTCSPPIENSCHSCIYESKTTLLDKKELQAWKGKDQIWKMYLPYGKVPRGRPGLSTNLAGYLSLQYILKGLGFSQSLRQTFKGLGWILKGVSQEVSM